MRKDLCVFALLLSFIASNNQPARADVDWKSYKEGVYQAKYTKRPIFVMLTEDH
jgi:hypothetical protein